MDVDDLCEAGLVLGLGLATDEFKFKKLEAGARTTVDGSARQSEPSLTLSLPGEQSDQIRPAVKAGSVNDHDLYGQDSSSLSNVSVKREPETAGGGSEEVEIEKVLLSRVSDEDDDGSNARKKLRLTKAQSGLLEESFKHHSTLNPKQKVELARNLKLRPRQVEVWFQNRRARTKLKQTEIDCEFLKRCCESLTDENRRLQKELQELKSLKLTQPLYMQLPAATLTMCPSCERMGGGASENAAQRAFAMAPKPRVFNPFPNPSAAC